MNRRRLLIGSVALVGSSIPALASLHGASVANPDTILKRYVTAHNCDGLPVYELPQNTQMLHDIWGIDWHDLVPQIHGTQLFWSHQRRSNVTYVKFNTNDERDLHKLLACEAKVWYKNGVKELDPFPFLYIER